MDNQDISVRNLKVLRERGRVTATVIFSKVDGPYLSTVVELDLGQPAVRDAVAELEGLVRDVFKAAVALGQSFSKEPEATMIAPAKKAAPRKRATRHI